MNMNTLVIDGNNISMVIFPTREIFSILFYIDGHYLYKHRWITYTEEMIEKLYNFFFWMMSITYT